VYDRKLKLFCLLKVSHPEGGNPEENGNLASESYASIEAERLVAHKTHGATVMFREVVHCLLPGDDLPSFGILFPYLKDSSSLKEIIENNPSLLTFEARISIIRQLAEYIRDLDKFGEAHGDLKSSNIMWTPSGNVLVIDLGSLSIDVGGLFHQNERLRADGVAIINNDDYSDHSSVNRSYLKWLSESLRTYSDSFSAPEVCFTLPSTLFSETYSFTLIIIQLLAGQLFQMNRPHIEKKAVWQTYQIELENDPDGDFRTVREHVEVFKEITPQEEEFKIYNFRVK
jgi:serine/threonine protein kinase